MWASRRKSVRLRLLTGKLLRRRSSLCCHLSSLDRFSLRSGKVVVEVGGERRGKSGSLVAEIVFAVPLRLFLLPTLKFWIPSRHVVASTDELFGHLAS